MKRPRTERIGILPTFCYSTPLVRVWLNMNPCSTGSSTIRWSSSRSFKSILSVRRWGTLLQTRILGLNIRRRRVMRRRWIFAKSGSKKSICLRSSISVWMKAIICIRSDKKKRKLSVSLKLDTRRWSQSDSGKRNSSSKCKRVYRNIRRKSEKKS